MSDNPFAETPGPINPTDSPASAMVVPKFATGTLTTILVCCLILGICGLFATCMTGVYVGFQSTIEKMVLDMPAPIEQKEFQKINLDVQKKVLVPGLVVSGINFFVATMLIVGSIGGLGRKSSGRSLLRLGLLMAIFYLVLKIVVTIYMAFATSSGLNDAIANYQGEAEAASLEQMAQFAKIGSMVGTAFGVLIPVALLGFYIWARIYLNKEQVVQHFESKS